MLLDPNVTGSTTTTEKPHASAIDCLDFFWHDSTGRVWDIGDPTADICLGAGTTGLTMRPLEDHTTRLAGQDGQIYRGHSLLPAPVLWVIYIRTAPSQAWLDLDSAWWETLEPGTTGTWEVRQPNGESRFLDLRCVGDGDPAWDTDPALTGRARYLVELIADQPLWYGPTITDTWQPDEPIDFFGAADGLGPDFYLTSGKGLSEAVVTNPGRVAAWLTWTITGVTTDATVGQGPFLTEVPFTVAAGEQLVIDTSPTAQTAILIAANGTRTDRTADLDAMGWAPIPVGTSQPLALSMTGAGAITHALEPRYYRAW